MQSNQPKKYFYDTPQHATACPWHSPHGPRWDACTRHRSAHPFYHGRGGSRVHPSVHERQPSAPYCKTQDLRFKSLWVNKRSSCKLHWPAVAAVEVVGMVRVVFENERLLLDDGVTLLTDVLAETASLLAVMTRAAQVAGKNTDVWTSTTFSVTFITLVRSLSVSRTHTVTPNWLQTHRPAFLTNPTSASTAWQISQQKQSGCQLLFMALITRPIINSPAGTRGTQFTISTASQWHHLFVCLSASYHTDDSTERTTSGNHARSISFPQTTKNSNSEKHIWSKVKSILVIFHKHFIPHKRVRLETAGNTGRRRSTARDTAHRYCWRFSPSGRSHFCTARTRRLPGH